MLHILQYETQKYQLIEIDIFLVGRIFRRQHIPTSEIKIFLVALTTRVRSGGNTTAILCLRILWIVYKNRRESEIILQIVLIVKEERLGEISS